jgi:hypothetical protein
MVMAAQLLPAWLRGAWSAALILVAWAHLRHTRRHRGQRRWWHLGHTVMAVGMLAMYAAAPMAHPGWLALEAAVFAALTIILATTSIVLRRCEGATNPLWAAFTVNALAMAVMAISMALPTGYLLRVASRELAVYLLGEATVWILGAWYRITPARPSAGLSAPPERAVRASLAIMTTAMAYILATV